ncbi:flavin-containing monooxygenase [Dactylosporangium sp. CS-047395]|uniref:flavin-containing monooxygenase n=1 Tax=Dactylosporangium sp. CS-047395 TaxID=3239936 RepID=UPI003D8DD525
MADVDRAHVDVLIVGAGLSGIGAACHLTRDAPGLTYEILEARAASGGTWDLFRYPGVRSDTDMFTLGYAFRPWTDRDAIASGDRILGYLRDTAARFGVDRHITYRSRVVRAEWSTVDARWAVTVEGSSTRTCRFLFLCTGYYRYDEGYTPDWPGVAQYNGTLVHPQHWPQDLDVTEKQVVVIGSGATAFTLVPALARTAAHVTMLQRSPSFVLSLPARDRVADSLRRFLPPRAVHRIVRWKNIKISTWLYQYSRRRPARMRAMLRAGVRKALPDGYPIDEHFEPSYDPWDQRLCLVPDNDFFAAISSGAASVTTGHIATFTPTGLRLESGSTVDADVVITATGLNLLPLGDISLTVDGEPVDPAQRVVYKGMMLDGVPNLAFVLGYTNMAWTLKADLVSSYVTRLLLRMRRRGKRSVVPRLPAEPLTTAPLVEMSSGYFERSRSRLPLQGDRAPWRLRQHYARDRRLFRRLRDDALVFDPPALS